jgi:hypothetical protein
MMAMQFKYRVSKYNPKIRDDNGHYRKIEWTYFAQVGQTVGANAFTEQEYLKTENAYVSTALAFLQESGVDRLSLIDLQPSGPDTELVPDLRNGRTCNLQEADKLFRSVLRERFWCKFEWKTEVYVHFGWDYYMYLGIPRKCPNAIVFAEHQSLFVEPFDSPFLS